jgi:hypothetical protein
MDTAAKKYVVVPENYSGRILVDFPNDGPGERILDREAGTITSDRGSRCCPHDIGEYLAQFPVLQLLDPVPPEPQMTLYVCGPMTGITAYNFPEFARVTGLLRKAGYKVISPAEVEVAMGFDPENDVAQGYMVYMDRDCKLIDKCGGLALLDGWRDSEGSVCETRHADLTDKPYEMYEHWLEMADFYEESPPDEPSFVEIVKAALGEGEVTVTDPESGGQKGSKLARYDLLPTDALHALAEHFGKSGGDGIGPKKYEDRNWEKGYKHSLSVAAGARHQKEHLMGNDYDDGPGGSQSLHLTCEAWHALIRLAMYLRGIGTDDRVFKNGIHINCPTSPVYGSKDLSDRNKSTGA